MRINEITDPNRRSFMKNLGKTALGTTAAIAGMTALAPCPITGLVVTQSPGGWFHAGGRLNEVVRMLNELEHGI